VLIFFSFNLEYDITKIIKRKYIVSFRGKKNVDVIIINITEYLNNFTFVFCRVEMSVKIIFIRLMGRNERKTFPK
jgi:hypothetical protein